MMTKNEHLSKYYIANKDKLTKRVSRRVGDNDAEDVIQEVFFRANKYYHNWDANKAPFGRWLEGILRRCIHNCLKDQRDRGSVMVMSSDDLPESLQPAYDDSEPEVHEEVERVYKMVTRKGQPARDVLYMYYFMGNTIKEISEIQEIPYKTVQMTVYRFKKEIRSE
jgi:RNA polymerase sigma factor (sigma-70 family)